MNKVLEVRGILVSRERPSSSELLEAYMPGGEEFGSGLCGQESPCHKGIWPEAPVLHSECQRKGDLEEVRAEKEYEVASFIF